MTDEHDNIPPGHTHKPYRGLEGPPRKRERSWPKLGPMVWITAALICVASMIAGLFVTPTNQENLWMIVAMGAVALSVVAGDADRPIISGFDALKLFDLAFYGFKYALFSMLAALPGLYLGVMVRNLWAAAA